MFNFLKRKPVVAIRPWEARDIQAICALEDQGLYPIHITTLAELIYDNRIYGIVITEDRVVRGFAMAAILPKMPQLFIHALRVDKDNLRRGFGTRMLLHFCAKRSLWGKSSLCLDITDRNDVARKFLTIKHGFVAIIMHEYHDNEGNPEDALYTFEYPPPDEWERGKILIANDKGIFPKSFI